ncbi:hypothetical protein Hdeb2414_s0011g00362561 [Helianthus debilis subsp. tardiflorus]
MMTIREASSINDTVQENEGFNWSKYIPNEDKRVFVAEVKERTKEEILKEKTYRERWIVDYIIEEMEKEFEEARNYRRWDKKRECYINSKGELVIHPSKVVYNDVLVLIPLFGEYYSNVEKDKSYFKSLDKIIRDVMTVSLRQRDEEKMKKSVEDLVDKLKKKVERGRDEEKVEVMKKQEEVEEEQQEKDGEKLVGGADVGEVVGDEQQENEADQK